MKKLINFLVFIVLTSNCYSQEWGTVGTTWIYSIYPIIPIEGWSYDYDKYTSVKDTIIGSKTMRKIEFRNYYFNGNVLLRTEYMFKENNKIYFHKWGQNNLLYDFSLIQGESYIVQDEDNQNANGGLILGTVFNQTINGNIYKLFNFQRLTLLGFNDYILDQVGCLFNFFPNTQIASPPEYPTLQCFITGDSLYYYQDLEFCEYFRTLSLEESSLLDEKIKFYPNPISNSSILKVPSFWGKIKNVSINSLNGQKIDSYKIYNQEIEINKQDFISGIYLYEIETESKVFHGKFVVE